MDKLALHPAINLILKEISERIEHAARIAKAALASAEAGSVTEAVTLSMDIEQDLYEAGRLQDALSLLNRIAKRPNE